MSLFLKTSYYRNLQAESKNKNILLEIISARRGVILTSAIREILLEKISFFNRFFIFLSQLIVLLRFPDIQVGGISFESDIFSFARLYLLYLLP